MGITTFHLKRGVILLCCLAAGIGLAVSLTGVAYAYQPDPQPVKVAMVAPVAPLYSTQLVTVPIPTPFTVPTISTPTITNTLLEDPFWDRVTYEGFVGAFITFWQLESVQDVFYVMLWFGAAALVIGWIFGYISRHGGGSFGKPEVPPYRGGDPDV